MLSTDIPALLLLAAQIFFVLATLIFAVSAVDDLLIDAYFYIRLIYRKLRGKNYTDTPSVDQILTRPEQPLALMLPAWQESDVLYGAVANLIKTIDYKNYHVFIGVYPNDAETRAEADRLARQFRQVHTVVTRLPGPTCKADCLNNIIDAILAYEERRGISFAGVIMQDAEDIIHPLSMKLFNHYLPEYDLVQIPVYSLKRNWWQLTGGHYMDEFAEYHSKEILVRQTFAGVVPGAGVGTAMSKKALAFARQESGEYYNTHSLTEDYEFSFRTHGSELKQVFARIPVPEEINDRYEKNVVVKGDRTGNFIATRELFPNRFWWAVRQKTRWTIGISFQAWSSMGWKGNWRIKYLFWRDRKMIFFSHAIAMGFISIAIFLGYKAYHNMMPEGYRLAPLIAENSWLWNVVYFNLAVMAFRVIQRMGWSSIYYGWSASLMVAPRYVWAALINYLAIIRATRAYLTHLLTGKPIGWDKTSHDIPEMDEINNMKLPLGELLVKKQMLTQEQLDEAVDMQARTQQLLGRIILSRGWLKEADLIDVLAEKYHLPVATLDPFAVADEVMQMIPYSIQRKMRVIPFRLEKGRLEVASCRILDHDEVEQLEEIVKCHVDLYIATPRDINYSLHVFSKFMQRDQPIDPALEKLMRDIKARLSQMDITEVARESEPTRRQHVSLGEYLVKKGATDELTIETYLRDHLAGSVPFGKYLVEHGVISKQDCLEALAYVDRNFSVLVTRYSDIAKVSGSPYFENLKTA